MSSDESIYIITISTEKSRLSLHSEGSKFVVLRGFNDGRWFNIVVMIVRKLNPTRHHIGLKKCPWIPKGTIPLPDTVTTKDEFGKFIQSKFGQGKFYISLSAKRYKGFKTVFNGTVKKNKAVGSGKIHYYLAKNKEKQTNQN